MDQKLLFFLSSAFLLLHSDPPFASAAASPKKRGTKCRNKEGKRAVAEPDEQAEELWKRS
jgi:hypothetical protein